jgi:hypothetical protein
MANTGFGQSSYGYGTTPIAGSYLKDLTEQLGGDLGDLGKAMLIQGEIGRLQRQADMEQFPQLLKMVGDYQKQAAIEANEMGIKNQIVGSFLKDVPAAISNAFAQRQRYAPERIGIAARGMEYGRPGYGMGRYYGFVG